MSGGGSSQQSTLTRSQRGIADEIANFLRGKVGEGGTALPSHLINPSLIDEVRAFLPQIQATTGEGGFLQQEQLGALQRALSGQPSSEINRETTLQAFQQGVADPAFRQFDQQIAPRIAQQFASVGGSFNTRKGETTSRALQGLQTDLTGQLSNMFRQDEQLRAGLAESASQRALGAIPLTGQFGLQNIQRLGAGMQLLQPFQQLSDQQRQSQIEAFMRTMAPENSPWLQQAMAFTGLNHAQNVPGQPNPLLQVLGGMGGMAFGAGMMGSGPLGFLGSLGLSA